MTHLFLSFWDICLENLPHGQFLHNTISATEAVQVIRLTRDARTLQCVSNEDLLAPYRTKERRRHEELCALLRNRYGCPLQFEDFLTNFDGESGPVQSSTPLQLAELHPGQRLLVVTCNYRLADSVGNRSDIEGHFVLAEDSVTFHMITAPL